MSDFRTEYNEDFDFLHKLDPFIEYVLAKAETVSLFMFDTDIYEDIECDICGECYIYSRKEKPYFTIQICNRDEVIFLREPIVSELDWDLQNTMILHIKGKVLHSIMFHSEDEFDSMTSILTGILDSIKEELKLGQASSSPQRQTRRILPAAIEPNLLGNKEFGVHPSTSGVTKSSTRSEMTIEDLEVKIKQLEEKLKKKPELTIPALTGDEPTESSEKNERKIVLQEDGGEPKPTHQREIGEALLSVLSRSDIVSKIHQAYSKLCQKKKNN